MVSRINPDWEFTKFHNVSLVIATLGTKENPWWLSTDLHFGYSQNFQNVTVTLPTLGMLKKTNNGIIILIVLGNNRVIP